MTLEQRFQYMVSQVAYKEPRLRMVRRERIRYAELVPIEREASPYADVIEYYSADSTGDMARIANRADDYPMVEVSEQQHYQRIAWDGIAFDYSDREINRAMMVGQNLPDRKMSSCFRVAEERKQKLCYEGDETVGWHGLLNHSEIPRSDATKTWASASATEIFKQVNGLIGGAYADTNEARLCNTLLLPTKQRTMLADPIGDNADRSIESYIREYNPYTQETGMPLLIRTVPQLATAGQGGGTRAIAYVRDPEVLRFHVPRELTFIEPQRHKDRWIYYGNLVLAGLEWMEPAPNRYFDGI